ncbi:MULTISPECIES: glucuronate isomerase [unclassified Microbacterium]|uniref:glucuronate isomerase n=1 Tax=unclassified Microbacterium TaxID=2609290 RepID=UPI00214CB986|nr:MULTISPECIES: glucuronate isomerase [unclassified Microbacterium]MCR2785081.1 glucuronate isomerase [Microbacterium sp. zg.B96]WIM16614.1 glucuronate isomerase [Microbacterium sp. zg-B96]
MSSDALFPSDARTREIARDLYAEVESAPIISPHGHVDPRLLVEEAPFRDPAELLITRDHYVTRVLHSAGVPLWELGLDASRPVDPRQAWRRLAENWHRFAGTASGYWLTHELSSLFGVDEELGESSADRIYDRVAVALREPDFRPRALFARFGIEVLATTDDPLDDLEEHRLLSADPSFPGRVLPTFRPDSYVDPDAAMFTENVGNLLAATGERTTFAGYLAALAARRAHFVARGAVSADHGVLEPFTTDLASTVAEGLFQQAMSGTLEPAGARLFRGHMLFQMARMSVDDGLVMTVHPGVRRNHHTATLERYGPDTGHDIPVRTEYTENLRPLLEAFGTAPRFHLVLFAVDETVYSREIAPLAGFYPSVYIGAPWWFLDAPDAILRWRSAVTETAGFYRSSGFIDDTRAFLSIPARHDTARRVDASFLARLVAEGRVSITTARRIARDLVGTIPREVFKL